MANSWRTYFDKCWVEMFPHLPLPYNDLSPLTVERMKIVRYYAEKNASRWQLLKRRLKL
jgi:hypothetical protein